MPSGRRHTTRTPRGPSSPASCIDSASTAAQAGPNPSVGMATWEAVVDSRTITPPPCLHVAGCRRRREELRGRVGGDGQREVLGRQLGQRLALHVVHADGVERHVDAALGLDDGRRRGGRPPSGSRASTTAHSALPPASMISSATALSRSAVRPGEEHAGALAGERAGHRGADRTRTAVHDCGLVLKEHCRTSVRYRSPGGGASPHRRTGSAGPTPLPHDRTISPRSPRPAVEPGSAVRRRSAPARAPRW